ncbi:hypothetical protein SUGI_0470020 [Cryptomeria japonica]|uniref:myb-related protein 308 n=1 Tax=Cryptomeria japonica TaxID=3369 RepID=UPI002408E859|nr:myb-related protein 308 [Cryptomeria japonica]GLJ24593.1 hypothetical protein SUGI_0470020 [Cryptomeria japonica]
MGRSPCCEKAHTNKGAWTKEEDDRLIAHIQAHGEGCWRSLPKAAGLLRCGKSCRLRWINYLRPDLKRGNFSDEEDELIIKLHALLGNKWSLIAGRLPGRTDNEIKNYWNTHIKRKLFSRGIDPSSHRPINSLNNKSSSSNSRSLKQEIHMADFFQYDHSEVTSCFERVASDAGSRSEERADINLDLSISLPCSSPPDDNKNNDRKAAIDSKEIISNSTAGKMCCHVGLPVNYAACCENRYNGENGGLQRGITCDHRLGLDL